jgi:membrane protein DedA with SNARE-associated domain
MVELDLVHVLMDLFAVYLTRFLLAPIGIPTNLIAGSRQYAYWRFALAALAGDPMWVVSYGLPGYILG